ncbi:MAG TPA: PIG-L family deacetylase, partial [Bacteroidia bacterium]|nr:PIG-L family deacetylase [Bacteroidia bacterium]
MARFISLFAVFTFWIHLASSQPKRNSTADIRLSLEKLNTLGSVLYVAAHPDDENTRLLSYYANEKHFRTTYISMTRGDGGQNLIGSEQGELLGVIRTQELLAARRVDGAEQMFSRAVDFGYSKNPEETFSFWNKDSILADVVWAIRTVRPDIIIMRFPTTGEGGHGHHTASAILAVEAFKAAADPSRFPEQLKYVTVWQAQRIFWNMFRPKEEEVKDKPDITGVDIGSFNSLLGKSYGELSSESRSMHKSQGFGTSRSRGKQLDYLRFIDGTPFQQNELSGINTSWTRVKGGEAITAEIQKIIKTFEDQHRSASIPALFGLRKKIISEIQDDYLSKMKVNEFDVLILSFGGFFAEAFADNYSVTQ